MGVPINATSNDHYLTLSHLRNSQPMIESRQRRGTHPELTRLRRDFEREASRYRDATVTLLYTVAGVPPAGPPFRQPNHAIMLWQYLGQVGAGEGKEFAAGIHHTRHGVSDAQVSVHALIEGKATPLFVRMGSRAGSLVPDAAARKIEANLIQRLTPESGETKSVFSTNSNALAVWLNMVLTCLATFQPERLQSRTLSVDPFTASLAVFDELLSTDYMTPNGDLTPLLQRRFRVALSFPGERREFVETVAHELRKRVGDVFYDRDFEAELARIDLDVILQKVYYDNSDLIVVFLCEAYERKEWCGLEWRALRDLIKKRRGEKLMFMRFDDANIPGLFSTDGYIDLRGRTPEYAVESICRRLQALGVTGA